MAHVLAQHLARARFRKPGNRVLALESAQQTQQGGVDRFSMVPEIRVSRRRDGFAKGRTLDARQLPRGGLRRYPLRYKHEG